MPAIELRAVAKRFGSVVALDGLSLAVEPGESLCLFGPSGCGKTTALRLVAGFETPDAGEVRIHGVTASASGPNIGRPERRPQVGVHALACFLSGRRTAFLPPGARGVGMVFQDLALWPHMRVERHLDFVLRPQRLAPRQRAARIAALLALCRMSDRARAYPHELSGGQQQRLAIVRALAAEPRILLLDEPFTGLDAELRDVFRDEILRLKREKGAAILFATHYEQEMDALADRTLFLDGTQPRNQ